MTRNPLYLVIPYNDPVDNQVLQMRTSLNLPVSYHVELIDDVDDSIILRMPEPIIIEIARGRRDDLYGLANKLFGARWGAWTYMAHGDKTFESYQIQGPADLRPRLTRRETRILRALERTPNQTVDDLCVSVREAGEEDSAIGSAVRFLYENGFVIVETPEQRYSVRRTE